MPPRNVTLYVMVLSRHLSCGVKTSLATAGKENDRKTTISEEINLSIEHAPHEVNKWEQTKYKQTSNKMSVPRTLRLRTHARSQILLVSTQIANYNFIILKSIFLDCLIREMLFIREKKPKLNTQSDSIRAKVFV